MKITIHARPGEGMKISENNGAMEAVAGDEGVVRILNDLGMNPAPFLPLKWEKRIEIMKGEDFIRIKAVSSGKRNRTNERLREMLRKAGAKFREFSHAEAKTSEEAARIRGTELRQGVKCLVAETGEGDVAILVPANTRLERKRLKKRLENISLASPEKAERLTGCKVGGIPPIGHGLPVFASERIFENDTVVFNSGFRTHSIICDSMGFRKALELCNAEFFE